MLQEAALCEFQQPAIDKETHQSLSTRPLTFKLMRTFKYIYIHDEVKAACHSY